MDEMPPEVEEIGKELIARLVKDRRMDLVERVVVDVTKARLSAWMAIEQAKWVQQGQQFHTSFPNRTGVIHANSSTNDL